MNTVHRLAILTGHIAGHLSVRLFSQAIQTAFGDAVSAVLLPGLELSSPDPPSDGLVGFAEILGRLS